MGLSTARNRQSGADKHNFGFAAVAVIGSDKPHDRIY
jgi:hypothetical protein